MPIKKHDHKPLHKKVSLYIIQAIKDINKKHIYHHAASTTLFTIMTLLPMVFILGTLLLLFNINAQDVLTKILALFPNTTIQASSLINHQSKQPIVITLVSFIFANYFFNCIINIKLKFETCGH